jgi:hypothetical protein
VGKVLRLGSAEFGREVFDGVFELGVGVASDEEFD